MLVQGVEEAVGEALAGSVSLTKFLMEGMDGETYPEEEQYRYQAHGQQSFPHRELRGLCDLVISGAEGVHLEYLVLLLEGLYAGYIDIGHG